MFSKIPPRPSRKALCRSFVKRQFTGIRLKKLQNPRSTTTTENRTHVDMQFFSHEDLQNNLVN